MSNDIVTENEYIQVFSCNCLDECYKCPFYKHMRLMGKRHCMDNKDLLARVYIQTEIARKIAAAPSTTNKES